MDTSFLNTPLFVWVVIPLCIFIARIVDMTLDTLRIIFVSRGYKAYAVLCGFFGVFIWVTVIAQIITHVHNPVYYVAYAAGFATGNFVGMVIEEKIALGYVILRVMTPNPLEKLIDYLKVHDHGVTMLDAQGLHGNVKILFSIVPRTALEDVVAVIREVNPHAFYTVEDIRFINELSGSFTNSPVFNRRKSIFTMLRRKSQ